MFRRFGYEKTIVFLSMLTLLCSVAASVQARRRGYKYKPRYHRPAPRKYTDRRCLRGLRSLKVRFRRLRRKKGMATAVRVYGRRLGRTRYKARYGRKRMVMDCRLALALRLASPLFRASGIGVVIHGDFYRWRRVKKSGRLSRHALGLAIDMYGFINKKGRRIWVKKDYERNLATRRRCEGRAKTWKGRVLRDLACDLDNSGLFETILTPDYDRHHRDHFHVSVFHPLDRRRWRKHRTGLLGSLGRYRWIRGRLRRGKYSRARVRRIFRQRRRALRRWYRRKHKQKLRKKRRKRRRRRRK